MPEPTIRAGAAALLPDSFLADPPPRRVENKIFLDTLAIPDVRAMVRSVTGAFRLLGPDAREQCGRTGLWTAMSRFDPRKGRAFLAFLYVAVRRECLKELEASRPRHELPGHAEPADREGRDAHPRIVPEGAPALEALARLPPRLREAARLRHLEGRTVREVGLRLGLGEARARRLLGRAAERLERLFIQLTEDRT